jgi:hypothetical protein
MLKASRRQDFVPVNEVAPFPVATIVLLSEIFAFLCLVFYVLLVISQKLMRPVGKLTLLLKRTVAFLHELLAKFGLLLGAIEGGLMVLRLEALGRMKVVLFVGVGRRAGVDRVVIEYLHHCENSNYNQT